MSSSINLLKKENAKMIQRIKQLIISKELLISELKENRENMYIQKIIELNKELAQKQQRVFTLRNDLNDYKKSPVTTVPIGLLADEIFMLEDNCIQIEKNILKISKFIGK